MSHKHRLLTPDREHQKVFAKFPIIGFPRVFEFPPVMKNEGFWGPSKTPDVRSDSTSLDKPTETF